MNKGGVNELAREQSWLMNCSIPIPARAWAWWLVG